MFSWLRLRHLRRKAEKLERQEQRRWRQRRAGGGSITITASGPGTVIAANTINGNLTITNSRIDIENTQGRHVDEPRNGEEST